MLSGRCSSSPLSQSAHVSKTIPGWLSLARKLLGMYERSKISSLGAVDWWEICHALLLNYSFAFSNNCLGQITLILSEASASFPLKSAFEYLVTVAMERRNKRHGEKRGCKMPGCDATTVLTPRQQDGCGLGTRLDCC